MAPSDNDGRILRRGPETHGYSRLRIGLVALAVGMIATFVVYFTINARANADQAARTAEREIRNLANLMAEQTAQAIAAINLAVLGVAVEFDEPEFWDGTESSPRVADRLKRYAAADPAISRILLVDPGGALRAATDATPPGTSFAHRAFMAEFGNGARLGAVAPPVDDGPECSACAAISAPILARDGTQIGIAVAEVPRAFFERLYSKIDSGKRSVFAVIDTRGNLLARVPPIERADRATTIASNTYPIAVRAFERGETLVERTTGRDGMERLFAFAPVSGRALVVYAGIAPEDYLAEWRSSLQITLPFAAIVLATFTFLILALARHLGRIEENARTLRLADQRFQALVANIPGVVFQRRRTPAGTEPLSWISAAVEMQLGHTQAAMMANDGRLFLASVLPEDRAAFDAAFASSAADMSALMWSGRMRRRDGQTISVEITARPRLGHEGLVVWEGIALDISARVAADAALAGVRAQLDMKKEQLETALSNMAQGMCVYDADLRLVVFNRRYIEIFGLERMGIGPGTPLADVLRASAARGNYEPEIAEAAIEERLEAARARNPRTLYQRLTDGRTIEVDVRPLADGGSVASFTDISDREAAQEALRQAKEQAELADRSKSQFLANMSHELRTPLNAIIGFSEIMTDKLFGDLGDPRYAEYALDIRESGRHLLMLINDILDLSKIEAGQANLREEQVSLAEIVDVCVRLVGDRAQRGGLTMEVGEFEDFPPLWADRLKLKQILLNLLSNAIKFTPSGGTVGLAAQRTLDGGIAVHISDTGIGMRAQDIPAALQPFRQVESSLSRKHEGTGLGLPLTKAIVEMHGGALTIGSVPGKGTSVIFTLPPERVIDPQGMADSMLTDAIQAARGAL
jgi:signal transduction histidine kinase